MLKIDWHLTNRCNFDCDYCHPHIKRDLNRIHLNEPPAELVVRRFNELGVELLVHMSGGEPFMYPNFVRLCQGLTRNHFISINTNLSGPNTKEFGDKVDPSKVKGIAAAVHVAERLRKAHAVEAYADNFLYLKRRGFPVVAVYILYPPLIERCHQDIDRISELGVEPIVAKVFKGVYNHKRYPDSYSAAEKEVVRRYSGKYRFNEAYLAGQMSFTGQACRAGRNLVKVNVTGDVQRCASVKKRYGNLYAGTFVPDSAPKPCEAKRVLVVSECHEFLVHSPVVLTNG